MPGTAVVALGGNAISPEGERDTIENQFRHTTAIASRLARMLRTGWTRLVVTHGNGPQVGNIVARVEHSREIAPWLPLDICVADTQGGMGYMIQQCLSGALAKASVDTPVATVVTQVEVDADDPAFGAPTKPIGPSRRLVASPRPLRVLEAGVIRILLERGAVVIAGGGGGVPVVASGSGWRGVEAVVDKDLTASLIAQEVAADALVILTSVDAVYLDHGAPGERRLAEIKASELRGLLDRGLFPPGSMGPKVEAACDFVGTGGSWAVIAALEDLDEALEGRAGTRISS